MWAIEQNHRSIPPFTVTLSRRSGYLRDHSCLHFGTGRVVRQLQPREKKVNTRGLSFQTRREAVRGLVAPAGAITAHSASIMEAARPGPHVLTIASNPWQASSLPGLQYSLSGIFQALAGGCVASKEMYVVFSHASCVPKGQISLQAVLHMGSARRPQG